jgi:DNA-binding transcriptional LysR family regulator
MRQIYCRNCFDKNFFAMRSLNLDQLQALIDVADLGSFSAAARRLNLTQPAVSLQIRELEKRAGIPLIERIGKRAFPTAAGRELLDHARRLRAGADAALNAMKRHKDGNVGRVHIGTGVTALTYLLPTVLRKLRADHPGIELVVTTGTTQGVAAGMIANEIDLGVVTLPVDTKVFEATTLLDDPILALLPGRSRGSRKPITAAELAQHPLILEQERSNHSRIGRRWLQAAGYDGRPVMEIDNMEAIKQLVAAGLGAAIVPASALSGNAGANYTARPLTPPAMRRIALIERRDKPDNRALRIVREALLSLREARKKTR